MSLNTDTTMNVVPAYYGGGGGMFGNNNDWWILLLFFFGWGGCGWGGNGGNCGAQASCATVADVNAAVGQQTLTSKLDQQTYGIADATFALNNTISTGFASAELSRCNQMAALMQQLNNMQHSADDCCCKTQRAIDGVNYNLATQACETRNLIQNITRDITDNANANARAILDAMTAQRIEAKDARIAEQDRALFMANLRESQATQNAYLLGYLDPRPVPSYPACPPNGRAGWGNWGNWNGGGCNPCAAC